jgi:hypothetical protein
MPVGQDRRAERVAPAPHRHVAHLVGVVQVDHGGAVGEVQRHQQPAAVRRDRQLLRPGVWCPWSRERPARAERWAARERR